MKNFYKDNEFSIIKCELDSLDSINVLKLFEDMASLNIKTINWKCTYENIKEIITSAKKSSEQINHILEIYYKYSKQICEIKEEMNSINMQLLIKIDEFEENHINNKYIKNDIINYCINEENYNEFIKNHNNLFQSTELLYIISIANDVAVNGKKYSELLSILQNIDDEYSVGLDRYHYPVSFIKEHPCNVFMCNGNKCHGGKSNLPRTIIIDKNGELYPDSLIYNNLRIGNICEKPIILNIEKYNGSDEHIRYLNLNKQIYKKRLLTYPLQFIPWISYLENDMRNTYV